MGVVGSRERTGPFAQQGSPLARARLALEQPAHLASARPWALRPGEAPRLLASAARLSPPAREALSEAKRAFPASSARSVFRRWPAWSSPRPVPKASPRRVPKPDASQSAHSSLRPASSLSSSTRRAWIRAISPLAQPASEGRAMRGGTKSASTARICSVEASRLESSVAAAPSRSIALAAMARPASPPVPCESQISLPCARAASRRLGFSAGPRLSERLATALLPRASQLLGKKRNPPSLREGLAACWPERFSRAAAKGLSSLPVEKLLSLA